MPKKRLTKIAEEYDTPFEEALEVATEKLPKDQITGKGRVTWIGEIGQDILASTFLIDEITPKHYSGVVKSIAPNPRYAFVVSKELMKKVPVMIPKRLSSGLTGKLITFEAIVDDKGTSYRYVGFRSNY